MKANSTKKNIINSLIGNLVYGLGQYFILVLFIKYFSKEEVGTYLFALAFVAPISMALDLQLRTLYVTEIQPEVTFSDYYTYRYITNLISVLLLVFSIVIYRKQYFSLVFIIALTRAVESHLDLIYGVYQKRFRLDFVAKSRLFRAILSTAAIFVTILLTKSIIYSLIAYILIKILIYIIYERQNVIRKGFLSHSDFKLKFHKKNIKYLVIQTSPLIFAILIDKYYANYPRLAIESYLGVSDLAIFGSLLYFKSLAGQIIAAVGQATAPNLTKYWIDKKFGEFKKLVDKLVLFGLSIGLVGVIFVFFFGHFALTILYSKQYANYANVLIIILIGAAITFSYIYIGTAITCLRKQWVKLPISAFGLITIFVLFKIIDPQNLMSIAYMILCVESCIFILYFLLYKYYLNNVIKKNI